MYSNPPPDNNGIEAPRHEDGDKRNDCRRGNCFPQYNFYNKILLTKTLINIEDIEIEYCIAMDTIQKMNTNI